MPSQWYWDRKRVVEEHRARFGDVCPGWRRKPHRVNPETNPLTCDHIRPRSKGGPDEGWNYQVLCRQCNSAKKNRTRGGITTGPTFPHLLR